MIPSRENSSGSAAFQALPRSPTRRYGGGSVRSEAELAHDVHAFKVLCRRRDQQYADLQARACLLEDEAEESDMELVYALDRAEFSQAQMQNLIDTPDGRKALPQSVKDFLEFARDTDVRLQHHLSIQDETQDRRERTARVVSHLRLLQSLCRLSEKLPGSQLDQGLAALLHQCEEKLLAAYDGDAELGLLASELCEMSTLHTQLSLLYDRQFTEDVAPLSSGTQDQWLLPVIGTPQKNKAEEDLRLQREIEHLIDRNEALRSELREETSQHGSFEAEARGAADVEAEAAKESERWRHSVQVLTDEVAELQTELARYQADLPQLESKAATARLQLGCERSTVAKQIEETARCRIMVPALMRQLRELAPLDRGSRERQMALVHLRRELAEAYAALAAAEASASLEEATGEPAESIIVSTGSPGEIAHLQRKLEVAKAVNAGLKQAVEARSGAAQGHAKQLESRNELISKVAKNTKEIIQLKEQLRRQELQEERIKRQENRGGAQPPASPAPEQNVWLSATLGSRLSHQSQKDPLRASIGGDDSIPGGTC